MGRYVLCCARLGSLCVYERSWYIPQESSGGKREGGGWGDMGDDNDSDEKCWACGLRAMVDVVGRIHGCT
jgi:hypothetical protein